MSNVKPIQKLPLKYDPATGVSMKHQCSASVYRQCNSKTKWHFNPWTGEKRDWDDLEYDPYGQLIIL